MDINLVNRTAALRLRAEHAQNHDALELLDSVDDLLNGPLSKSARILGPVAAFLNRIESELAR
jgi:primosomal protein N'